MDETNLESSNPKHKILVVDDNPHNIKLLEIVLTKNGYYALTANNGRDALRIAQSELPDLIFLDIMMPEMDGFDVCSSLKRNELTKEIPIIFLTSRSDTEGIVRGFELGAADYVTKPFNKTELLARMRTHIELRKSRDAVVDLERKNSILAMITTTNHEINQPLTVLSGNIYLLKNMLSRSKVPPEFEQSFKRMEDAVTKIKNILEKYRNAVGMRFEKYSGESKMIVFDDSKK